MKLSDLVLFLIVYGVSLLTALAFGDVTPQDDTNALLVAGFFTIITILREKQNES